MSAEEIFAKSSDRGGTKISVDTTAFPLFGLHSQSFTDYETDTISVWITSASLTLTTPSHYRLFFKQHIVNELYIASKVRSCE